MGFARQKTLHHVIKFGTELIDCRTTLPFEENMFTVIETKHEV